MPVTCHGDETTLLCSSGSTVANSIRPEPARALAALARLNGCLDPDNFFVRK
jgi:hypothetical protein